MISTTVYRFSSYMKCTVFNHRSESISEQNGATADRDLLEAVKAPNHELHSYIETEPHSYIATKAASTKGGGAPFVESFVAM